MVRKVIDDVLLAMWLVGLKTVLDLLKSPDEAVVGNAALCLSHCAELPKVCKALAKTNIIMELLVLARDKTKPTVQHNCAILIAKLSQGDHRLDLKLKLKLPDEVVHCKTLLHVLITSHAFSSIKTMFEIKTMWCWHSDGIVFIVFISIALLSQKSHILIWEADVI